MTCHCAAPGCEKEAKGPKGYCWGHYHRLRNHGSLDLPVKKKSPCSIDGCDNLASTRGWCKSHYARWRRTGDPIDRRPTVLDRFHSAYKVDPDTGCWLWQRPLNPQGYGWFKLDGKDSGAHRAAYQLLVGQIPDGLVLDHLCRVRNCVNPAHLEPVTQRENTMRGVAPNVLAHHRNECVYGHELVGDNVFTEDGVRRCRTCRRAQGRKQKSRAKSA